MKQLIINADDFGLNNQVNEAIITLLQKERITSTTVMANFVTADYLAKLASIKNISVGMHICLNEGKPLCNKEEIYTIVDKDGSLYSSFALYKRFLLGKVNKKHIEKEIEAQLSMLVTNGINISHVDSHQHLHQFPILSPVIMNCLKKFRIKKVRTCAPNEYFNKRMGILKVFTMLTSKYLKSFITPEKLIVALSVEKEITHDYLDKVFQNNDVVEIMTHPSLNNDKSYINKESEYNYFMSDKWLNTVSDMNIKLTNFHQL